MRVRVKIAGELHAYGTGPDRFGLIHADLVPENLLVEFLAARGTTYLGWVHTRQAPTPRAS
jgi:hypothetical protein